MGPSEISPLIKATCSKPSAKERYSFIRQIRSQKADLGVIADFGIILASEVLEAFPKGIINIHPSLLPKYRGPTPVQTAILNGDTKTGMTIIKIDDEVDHGSILYQEEADIKPDETAEALLSRLFGLILRQWSYNLLLLTRKLFSYLRL